MRKTGTQFKGSLMLLICAFIWGTAFVAQSAGMDHLGPCTFNGVRNFIACIALLPVIFVSSRMEKKVSEKEEAFLQNRQAERKTLLLGGVLCGLFLCTASLFQQFGIKETSVGKAGFLTALYIVIVPVLGIFRKKFPRFPVWIGVGLALLGTYLLSVKEGFSISGGDTMVMISAVLFSFHILVVDHFSPRVNGILLSWIQFFVSGVISLTIALIWEKPQLSSIGQGLIPLLYTGVLSSGVGYTLQVLGQKRASPTVASLILSLESVFAALSGWAIRGDALSLRECLGCALVFCAVIIAQLPESRRKNKITSSQYYKEKDGAV